MVSQSLKVNSGVRGAFPFVSMGNCLSTHCARCDMVVTVPFHGKNGYCSNIKNDLHGSTFSHYSLTSDTSFLDLYPTLRYMENDQSSSSAFTGSCCAEFNDWRHSSLPLIDDDDILELGCSHTLEDNKSMVSSDCARHPTIDLDDDYEANKIYWINNIEGNSSSNGKSTECEGKLIMLNEVAVSEESLETTNSLEKCSKENDRQFDANKGFYNKIQG